MVPFFVQIRGNSTSVLALYGQSDEGWVHRLLHIAQNVASAPRIMVTVKRQVVVNTKPGSKSKLVRSYMVGTGSMRPVPPGYMPPGVEPDALSVNYEGEIRFISSLSTGSFDIGSLRISVSTLYI